MGVNLIPDLRSFEVVDFDFPDAAAASALSALDKQLTAGSILDGCVTAGKHRILKFDFLSKNVGDADLVIGSPTLHPSWYEWSPSHGHWHLKDFNTYAMYDANGNQVAPGKKQGFCMLDVEAIAGWAGPKKPKQFDDCVNNQGVTVGWADVYGRDLACQFIVIDGVADGDYTIVATTNAQRILTEDTYEDNTICKGVRIHGTHPVVEILPPLHVQLKTPVVTFNDVPEGETAARPVYFEVRSCRGASFAITSGPTVVSGPPGTTFGTVSTPGSAVGDVHSLLPRSAYLWLTYKGSAAGDTATGSMKVKCNETGQEWTVPITANTIKRPTVAVVLTLDQSGSMGWPAGTGKNRIDVLREAGSRFVQLAQPNNGIGIVRFDHKAYPIRPVLKLTDPLIDPNRAQLVADVNGTTPNGATSIGNGLVAARATIDPVTGYDKKAIVVFTDGLENTSKFIADVKGLINDRTYAIGLGTAQQVSAGALTSLTNGTGGYLLVSGALSSAVDDYFRLSKYFLQILAAVTNNNIVTDPSGYAAPGADIRIPFVLNASDIDATAILLTELPVLQFGLETPSGHIVWAAEATALGATVAIGTNMVYYRFALPLVPGGEAAHAGVWHAVVRLQDGLHRRLAAGEAMAAQPSGEGSFANGVRYSVSVHTYSNVRLQARLSQSSLEPGATLTVRAALSEFDIPLAGTARVHAEVIRPDGTQTVLPLAEGDPGQFEGALVAAGAGVYQFRLLAAGWTHRGESFTREQALTAAVLAGGNAPFPTTPPATPGNDLACRLLDCLLSNAGLERWLEEHHVDPKVLLRCLRSACEAPGTPPSDRELAEREGMPAPQPAQAELMELLARPELARVLTELLGRTNPA